MGRGGIFAVDSPGGIYAVVVDDDKERRLLVAGILRYCGALVTPVETLDAAIAVMQLLKPDVVITDFSSPDEVGLPLIRRLRSLKPDEGGTIGTVAIGDGEHAEIARLNGYDAYVAKPLDPWDLCRVVTTLLNN